MLTRSSLMLVLVLASGASAASQDALVLRSKQAAFEDVKFELQNAIVGRGLTVETNGDVGAMLERTGADLGNAKPIYKQAEYFSFCSAKLSRATMEADPANLGFCPYVVFMYETVAAPGTVHIGYRTHPPHGSAASKAALAEVDKLLAAIVDDAVK